MTEVLKVALKDDLRPVGRNRVIDLVRAAGIDVSDWSNFSRGAKFAAVNPKYCYEWSFVDTAGTVVLNLWFSNIVEHRGEVTVSLNMREVSQDLSRKGSKGVWIARASRMDDAIRFAWDSNARVRVIFNDGVLREADDVHAKASVVRSRVLDPLPWTIRKYERSSGACILARGDSTIRKVDQFEVVGPETDSAERRLIQGSAFIRNPSVRASALERAAGHCEFCGAPGFVTPGGEVFLETHHIVPLSQGGSDTLENVAAVCPNHHREAHHGASADVIREFLLDVASRKS